MIDGSARVLVLDYGMGNLRSVEKALEHVGERSDELGGAEGLGLLPGAVTALDAPGLKVPNIGWAPVRWERESRLTAGIASETPFYLVHSFVARAAAEDALGTAEYGERFACAAE